MRPKNTLAVGSRRIKDELYRTTDYDGIWYLNNAGFVIRLEGTYIFVDPMLHHDESELISRREKYRRGFLLTSELRHYDAEEIESLAAHFPLLAAEIEKVDYLLISHDHGDHLHKRSIQHIAYLNPTVLAPKPCHALLSEANVDKDSILDAKYGSKRL